MFDEIKTQFIILREKWEEVFQTLNYEGERRPSQTPTELETQAYKRRSVHTARSLMKYLDAGGIAITGSENVSDMVFYAAKEIILTITSKRSEIREVLSRDIIMN